MNPEKTDKTEKIETLKSLYRGEVAACETYRQAIDRIGSDPAVSELRTLESEHRQAVQALEKRLRSFNEVPSGSSGPWGAWAKTVQGTANVLGRDVALKSLKEGEEHGIKDYERAARDQDLDPETRTFVESTLLPRQRTHVQKLDSLMKMS